MNTTTPDGSRAPLAPSLRLPAPPCALRAAPLPHAASPAVRTPVTVPDTV